MSLPLTTTNINKIPSNKCFTLINTLPDWVLQGLWIILENKLNQQFFDAFLVQVQQGYTQPTSYTAWLNLWKTVATPAYKNIKSVQLQGPNEFEGTDALEHLAFSIMDNEPPQQRKKLIQAIQNPEEHFFQGWEEEDEYDQDDQDDEDDEDDNYHCSTSGKVTKNAKNTKKAKTTKTTKTNKATKAKTNKATKAKSISKTNKAKSISKTTKAKSISKTKAH